jgi:hypothetical protein
LSITHHTRKRPSTGPRTTHGPHLYNNGLSSHRDVQCHISFFVIKCYNLLTSLTKTLDL